MASLRFGLTNLIQTALLMNGSGGSPARDETSPWLMENAQNRDRGLVWQGTAACPAVDFDLAATSTLRIFAVLGHRGAPSSVAGITSVEVFTQAGAYNAAGVWTSRGTIALGSGARNGALILGANVTGVDSVRFTPTTALAFTIGRLWAGALDLDLGIVSSPGYMRREITPRHEQRGGGGMLNVKKAGDVRWEYDLPFLDVVEAGASAGRFANLKTLGSQLHPFLMLDRDDTPHEVVVRDGIFEHSLLHDTPDRQDLTLRLETLG